MISNGQVKVQVDHVGRSSVGARAEPSTKQSAHRWYYS